MLSPRVPGPRCPGISRDILGCPRSGGSVKSQSPRSKMSWDIQGHPRMSLVHDVLGYPQDIPGCSRPGGSVRSRISRDILNVPDLEAVLGPRVPGPRCPGTSLVSMFYVHLTVSPQIGNIFVLTNFIYKLYLCEVYMLKFQSVFLQTR